MPSVVLLGKLQTLTPEEHNMSLHHFSRLFSSAFLALAIPVRLRRELYMSLHFAIIYKDDTS